jgi:hypothetical protein
MGAGDRDPSGPVTPAEPLEPATRTALKDAAPGACRPCARAPPALIPEPSLAVPSSMASGLTRRDEHLPPLERLTVDPNCTIGERRAPTPCSRGRALYSPRSRGRRFETGRQRGS